MPSEDKPSSSSSSFQPRRNVDYESEKQIHTVTLSKANIHPLHPKYMATKTSSSSSSKEVEKTTTKSQKINTPNKKNITTTINADFDDPLSMMLRGEITSVVNNNTKSSDSNDNSSSLSGSSSSSTPLYNSNSPILLEYERRKKTILSECTLTGRISVTTTDLTKIGSGDVDIKHALSLSSNRLAQLEKKIQGEGANEGDSTRSYTQEEYMANMNSLKNQITKAWNSNQRVTALKKAIMCAKMLADTRNPSFYPSMYVLISNIMDAFCELVRQRLTGRSDEFTAVKLSTISFLPSDVAQEAKETCRNWFFKIACIRELLPRILIEAALVPNYRFLDTGSYPRILSRLAHSIRGLGDPFVALHVRVYIATVCHKVLPDNPSVVLSMIDDYLFTFREFKQEKVRRMYLSRGVTLDEYVRLQTYAFDLLLRFAKKGLNAETSANLLKRYNKHCKHLTILSVLIRHIDADFVSKKASNIIALIRAGSSGSSSTALNALGERLCVCGDICVASFFFLQIDLFVHTHTHTHLFLSLSHTHTYLYLKPNLFTTQVVPPPASQRLSVLNDAWKIIKTDPEFTSYASSVKTYMELLIKFYSEREVKILLKDLIKHANGITDDELEKSSSSLEGVIEVLMDHAERRGFGRILTSQSFMQIVDLFRGPRKVTLCKTLLEKLGRKNEQVNVDEDIEEKSFSDPLIIHTVFDLARYLHDSIDSLSLKSERDSIASLICSFVSRIDFGNRLEQQLNIYVDCRAGFANLDRVNVCLVYRATNLAMKCHRIVKGRHTKKTSAFSKACLAFCHITIPTIRDVWTRFRMFRLCGSIALIHASVPQAETFFYECIQLISQMPKEIEGKYGKMESSGERVAGCCMALLSSLIVLPGHPVKGPLHLVQEFLVVVADASCWGDDDGYRAVVYVESLAMLCAMGQRKLPYRIKGVMSNDEL